MGSLAKAELPHTVHTCIYYSVFMKYLNWFEPNNVITLKLKCSSVSTCVNGVSQEALNLWYTLYVHVKILKIRMTSFMDELSDRQKGFKKIISWLRLLMFVDPTFVMLLHWRNVNRFLAFLVLLNTSDVTVQPKFDQVISQIIMQCLWRSFSERKWLQ